MRVVFSIYLAAPGDIFRRLTKTFLSQDRAEVYALRSLREIPGARLSVRNDSTGDEIAIKREVVIDSSKL